MGHDAWLAVELEDLADWRRCCDLLEVPVGVTVEAEATELRPVLEAVLHGWAAERTAPTAAPRVAACRAAVGVVQSSEDAGTTPSSEPSYPQVRVTRSRLVLRPESPYRLAIHAGTCRPRRSPAGADTTDVLRDWLGLAADDIEELLDPGAAFQA